jgi:hypothetical protein
VPKSSVEHKQQGALRLIVLDSHKVHYAKNGNSHSGIKTHDWSGRADSMLGAGASEHKIKMACRFYCGGHHNGISDHYDEQAEDAAVD